MVTGPRVLLEWLYRAAKGVFWLLPPSLRHRLHDQRHAVVSWLRRHSKPVRSRGDLDWLAFRNSILGPHAGEPVVIFESSIDWRVTLFQRPQHMALALGRQGCLVIYRTHGDQLSGFRRVEENVWIACDPAVDSIEGAVRCFYSTSLLADAQTMGMARERGVVAYEYIDHLDASISGGGRSLRRLQDLKRAAFAGAADLIVCSARSLHREAVAACGPARAVYIPNGVDAAHFRRGSGDAHSISQLLSSFRRDHEVLVGYYGAIAPWLWYEIIDQLCTLLPMVGFVFIGPDYGGCVGKLPRRPNSLYLGAVEYTSLPAHAQMFDVCFIPFRPGAVARSTSPLKLYEYFALGKPTVVTSDLAECVAFPEVFSGATETELVSAILRAADASRDSAFGARLHQLADENSWDLRAHAWLQAVKGAEARELPNTLARC